MPRLVRLFWLELPLLLVLAAAPARGACMFSSDCRERELCIRGVCKPSEIGNACDSNEDCHIFQEDEVLLCRNHVCVLECESDTYCSIGELCVQFRCEVDVGADRDRDGVPDGSFDQPRDNCPDEVNPDQDDLDDDGQGDECDNDDDNDGVPDDDDNCPKVKNTDQSDGDGDGQGDACESDSDYDGVPDWVDNCGDSLRGTLVANPDQRDTDGDGLGDRCDLDDDNDGVPDSEDPCPRAYDLACSTDWDGDGSANGEDPAPRQPNIRR